MQMDTETERDTQIETEKDIIRDRQKDSHNDDRA